MPPTGKTTPLNVISPVMAKSLKKKILLVVGISATMCHSAEKIPAKEGFLFK